MDNATPSRCRRPLGPRWRTANRGIGLTSAAIRRGFMGACPCYVDKKRGASQGMAWCAWMITRPGTRRTARRPQSSCRGLWRLQGTERSSAQQASVRGPRGPEPRPVRAPPEDAPLSRQACLHRGGVFPVHGHVLGHGTARRTRVTAGWAPGTPSREPRPPPALDRQ